jgi:putative PIN family toxin of toxin-antitoxin system
MLASYTQLARIIAAPPLTQSVSRDPDDDAVLACAIAAKADASVTGDKDLLVLSRYAGIPILTAREALGLIG